MVIDTKVEGFVSGKFFGLLCQYFLERKDPKCS